MARWAPERGWTSVGVRAALMGVGAAVLAWGLTTTISLEPLEGPSTQNVRAVQESAQDRRELLDLIQGQQAADAAARQQEATEQTREDLEEAAEQAREDAEDAREDAEDAEDAREDADLDAPEDSEPDDDSGSGDPGDRDEESRQSGAADDGADED